MATQKIHTVYSNRKGRTTEYTGTLEYLINNVFGYTLECGRSYQHERGNAKINTNPKTIKSLITNLNNATNNSAANGYSETTYSL